MLSGKAAEIVAGSVATKVAEQGTIWPYVIVFAMMAATLIVGYFKILPQLRTITSEARRDEMNKMGVRIEKLETMLETQSAAIKAADDRAHQSELKATTLATAVELLLSEISRLDPESPVIQQAQKLVTLAIQPPMQDMLTKLSTLPATGPTNGSGGHV